MFEDALKLFMNEKAKTVLGEIAGKGVRLIPDSIIVKDNLFIFEVEKDLPPREVEKSFSKDDVRMMDFEELEDKYRIRVYYNKNAVNYFE